MTWSHFVPTFGALFVIVMLRANATYWLGRGAAAGTRRWRRGEGEASPVVQRAQRLLHRWGPVAVVLCFLTVGIQTAVNATAGASRMPLRRYLPAVTLGSLIWASVYATVGLAAAQAWLGAAAHSPLAAVLAVLALAICVIALARWRRRPRGVTSSGAPVSRHVVTQVPVSTTGRPEQPWAPHERPPPT